MAEAVLVRHEPSVKLGHGSCSMYEAQLASSTDVRGISYRWADGDDCTPRARQYTDLANRQLYRYNRCQVDLAK